MTKEVKSKVYKAVKDKKTGKCVLVKKERPKQRIVVKRKPAQQVQQVQPPSFDQIQQSTQKREAVIKQKEQARQQSIRQALMTQRQANQIEALSRAILNTGTPSVSKITPPPQATPPPTPKKERGRTVSQMTDRSISRSAAKRQKFTAKRTTIPQDMSQPPITRQATDNELTEQVRPPRPPPRFTSSSDQDPFIKTTEQSGEGDGKIEGGMYNDEIEDLMKRHKSFQGAIAADKIPDIKPARAISFVINKDKTGESGSHWCAVYIDSVLDKEVCYYDPLGNPPSAEVVRDLKDLVRRINPKHQLKFKINTMKNQRNDTDTCAFHSMRFIKDMIAGKTFKEATGYCDKHKNNTDHFEEKAVKLANKFGYI
jgi:hypothetical protein